MQKVAVKAEGTSIVMGARAGRQGMRGMAQQEPTQSKAINILQVTSETRQNEIQG